MLKLEKPIKSDYTIQKLFTKHTIEPSNQIEIIMLRLCNVSYCPSKLVWINPKRKQIVVPLDHFLRVNKSVTFNFLENFLFFK